MSSRFNAVANVKENVGNSDADNKQNKIRQVAPIDGGSQRSQSKLLAAVSQAQAAKANEKSRPSSAKQLMKKKSGGSANALARDGSKGNITTPVPQESRGIEEDVKKVYTYDLSCKGGECKKFHYEGETENIKDAVRSFPVELYEAIQRNQLSGNYTKNSLDSAFVCSPLGRHIIDEHLKEAKSQIVVLNWWKENVAVQIKMHKFARTKVEGVTFKDKDKKPEFKVHQQEKEDAFNSLKKKQEEQYKDKLVEKNVLTNEGCFDAIWEQRYDELKQYALEHDGDTRVPLNYSKSLLLPKWVENQRLGYRRKYNLRPKLELETEGRKIALSDRKEMMLKEIGFAWYDVPKHRWTEEGIAVCEGWDMREVKKCDEEL